MIAFLHGELAGLGPDYALLDVGGVGYQVFLSQRTLSGLPAIGKRVKLFTHLVHREDAMLLYGFAGPEDREAFLLLLGISGVGAKTALSLLSSVDPASLATAVLSDRPQALQCPGIGKKIAARIVLELKEKFKERRNERLVASDEGSEVELALLGLGYVLEEVLPALKDLPEGLPVEEALRLALVRLSQ